MSCLWKRVPFFQVRADLSVEVKMNIFRLIGDLSHLLAIILLLWKIWKTRSCAGKFLTDGLIIDLRFQMAAVGKSLSFQLLRIPVKL